MSRLRHILENMSFRKGLIFAFVIGFLVRSIPEVLSFPYPIGFDTVYYAFVIKEGVLWPHWTSFFTQSWLFKALSVSIYNALGGDPFLLLKVFGPLLFGFNVAGVFWFSRRMLGWSVSWAFLAGVFFAVQLASLRISWDLLRNTLGLGLLMFTLPLVKRLGSSTCLLFFAFLSLLTVFAHEYAAVTLLFVVFGAILLNMVKGETTFDNRRALLAISPAAAVFLIGFYLRIFPVRYIVETNVLSARDYVLANIDRLFFLTNYLSVKTSVDFYPSYFDLLLSVGALFCILYLPCIFLVLKGFFRERLLNLWTGLLLVGAFGCMFLPFFALEYWHRWMFMLVYPFTFYAVNGLKRFVGDGSGGGFRLSLLDGKIKGMLLVTALLSGVYLASPILMGTANVGIFAIDPVNKFFSFSPTVPYEDVSSVAEAMGWLESNMGEGDCALLHHAFLWWGKFYLGDNRGIVYFNSDLDLALASALEHGFSRAYFVWWNTPIGWYGIPPPEGFVSLQNFGRISVYEFAV